MRRRIDELTVNTTSFKEDVEFSADTPHSVRIKLFPRDDIVPLHYAETLEILVTDRVDGSITVGRNKRNLLERDVVIIPPYYVHSTECKKCDGRLYNIKISFESMKAFMDIPALVAWSKQRLFSALFAPELFDDMLRAVNRLIAEDDNIFSRMHCILDIVEMLANLGASEEGRELEIKGGDEDRLRHLIQWTHEHFREHITLDMAAQQMNISRYYFCKFFKQATNTTYVTYLNQVRLEKAVQMMRFGKNVTECAMECGFESVSYFVQLFKRALGCTPGQFARSDGTK